MKKQNDQNGFDFEKMWRWFWFLVSMGVLLFFSLVIHNQFKKNDPKNETPLGVNAQLADSTSQTADLSGPGGISLVHPPKYDQEAAMQVMIKSTTCDEKFQIANSKIADLSKEVAFQKARADSLEALNARYCEALACVSGKIQLDELDYKILQCELGIEKKKSKSFLAKVDSLNKLIPKRVIHLDEPVAETKTQIASIVDEKRERYYKWFFGFESENYLNFDSGKPKAESVKYLTLKFKHEDEDDRLIGTFGLGINKYEPEARFTLSASLFHKQIFVYQKNTLVLNGSNPWLYVGVEKEFKKLPVSFFTEWGLELFNDDLLQSVNVGCRLSFDKLIQKH